MPILILSLESLMDCFMFNLGPGLIYGVLLASLEKCEHSAKTLF